MLKVKNAYYMRNLPTKIAVVLPDGQARVTNLTPFRQIKESELESLAAFAQPAYKKAMLQDEIPEYIFGAYGLEKV